MPLGDLGFFNQAFIKGKKITDFLKNLFRIFGNLMIDKITKADPKLIDLPQEICERLLQQAQNFSLDEIFSIFNTLVNTQEMSKRLESLRIPLEISLVKLAHDKRGANPNPAPKSTFHPQSTNHSSAPEVHKDIDPEPLPNSTTDRKSVV